MARFEYKVVPAPRKGKSGKGISGKSAKYAHALSSLMNEMGQDGYEYVRADTLPFDERVGLATKTVTYQNMLVFHRRIEDGADFMAAPAEPAAAPAPVTRIATATEGPGIVGVLHRRRQALQEKPLAAE